MSSNYSVAFDYLINNYYYEHYGEDCIDTLLLRGNNYATLSDMRTIYTAIDIVINTKNAKANANAAAANGTKN